MSADQFPSHWQLLPLSEAVDALIDYRGKTPRKTNHGVPLVTAKIVKGGTILPATEYIAEEDYDSWMVRGLPKAGDVVVTTEAPLGEVAQLANENVALAQRIVTLRGAEGLLQNDYLRYVMQGAYIQGQLESRATGSTVKGIKQSELRKIILPIPPEHEQIKIAGHLRALDDKIQLNHQINQTLEQMAQAIFKSWFVDFEPVKAKIAALEAGGSEEDALLAAMQAISGKAQAELTRLQAEQPEQYAELRATAELFPSAMQDSELGEIPEGWIYGTLSDLADFSSNRISKDELSLETYISTENMLENRKGVCTASSLPSSASVPSFESGEILISNIRPYFKKIWLANKSGGRSPDVLGFTCRHKGTNEYLFNLLYQDDFFEYMMLTSKGAKMPRGDKKAIMQFGSVIPPIGLMKYFSERVKPFYVLATSQTRESESLESLRDTLLPKLLSGELSVSNIEDQLAELEEPAHV